VPGRFSRHSAKWLIPRR